MGTSGFSGNSGHRGYILTTITMIALVLSVVCFASYGWANLRLFDHRGGLPLQMKFINGMGVAFFLAQLLSIARAKPIAWFSALGFCLYAVAFWLFWWAVPFARSARLNVAFTITQPSTLLTEGPYRFIRHPFYASYFSYWSAGILVSRQVWLLLSLICMGAFYISAILREEREFRRGPLQLLYAAYAKDTGCLFPRVVRS